MNVLPLIYIIWKIIYSTCTSSMSTLGSVKLDKPGLRSLVKLLSFSVRNGYLLLVVQVRYFLILVGSFVLKSFRIGHKISTLNSRLLLHTVLSLMGLSINIMRPYLPVHAVLRTPLVPLLVSHLANLCLDILTKCSQLKSTCSCK